jgi:VIT1/CCC1 family predicted Fe2+/Mn2+ transporter
VLPYLLGATTPWPGLAMTLVALFLCGAVVTSVTNRSWLYGGLRQVVLGAAATALTYGFGSLVGTGLA